MLDEVRPYLIADGGNVRVMGVDVDRRVVSRLSAATSKLSLRTLSGTYVGSFLFIYIVMKRILLLLLNLPPLSAFFPFR